MCNVFISCNVMIYSHSGWQATHIGRPGLINAMPVAALLPCTLAVSRITRCCARAWWWEGFAWCVCLVSVCGKPIQVARGRRPGMESGYRGVPRYHVHVCAKYGYCL